LAPLLEEGLIESVEARVASGKEADVWIVCREGKLVAAKVYKDRETRSFKQNAVYRDGRKVNDTRVQRAMDRKSRFGRRAAEEDWKEREHLALRKLHAAGVRVPRPLLFCYGVLLTELVVDAAGDPAPRLIDTAVPAGRAAGWYSDLRRQVVVMLTCDVIHGDLSPYNVLVARDGPTLIDFPQVVGAAHNRSAERFFRRDLEAIRAFFVAADPTLASTDGDATEIWQAYARRELTSDFVPARPISG
jgi:RIO kinase 1